MYGKTYGNNFFNLKTRTRQGQSDVDVEQSEAIMPKSVSLFVYYLLTDTKDDAHASKRAQWLVSSFGQYTVYAITYDKTKPHKAHHSAICSQVTDRECRTDTYTQPTWSQCILLPARLGHSVSYSQLDLVTVYPTPSSTWSQCILLPARLGHSVSYSQLDLVTVYPTPSSTW